MSGIGVKSLVLLTLVLSALAIGSEGRIARKDLSVDLGGIGVSVGAGLG